MKKEMLSRKASEQIPASSSQFASRPFPLPQQTLKVQAKSEGEETSADTITKVPIKTNYLSRVSYEPSSTVTPIIRLKQVEQNIGSNLGNVEVIQTETPINNLQAKFSVTPPAPLSQPQFPIQAKLTLGAPGDKYEQEADRVARQVVDSIHAPQATNTQVGESNESVTVQRKISIMASGGAGGGISSEWEGELNRGRGGGQALLPSLRAPMEREFNADFSGVRVHTGAQADELVRSIQAKAFTTGQDVFFRQGAYEPGSRGGQELIAHELTHVVQQSGGVVHNKSRKKTQYPDITFATKQPSDTGIEGTIQLQHEGKFVGTTVGIVGGAMISSVFPEIGTYLGPVMGGLLCFSLGYYYDSKAKENVPWQLYINPKDFAEANSLRTPGLMYDTDKSPGYKEGMVKAIQEELFAPNPNLPKQLNYDDYTALHDKVTAPLKKDGIQYSTTLESIRMPSSVEAATSYPIKDWDGEDVVTPAQDLRDEKILNMWMIMDWEQGMPQANAKVKVKKNRSVTMFVPDESKIYVRYDKEEGKEIVTAILSRYYEEVQAEGEEEKLRAIVKAVRALHVTHPFKDANGRLHVQIMLNKFLKEQEFGLTVMPEEGLGVFGGGYSLKELIKMVKDGIKRYEGIA